MSGDLELRYRRVPQILPGYYRQQWGQDMVAAFLEGSLTGDPEEDEFITEFGRPSWAEVANVVGSGWPQRCGRSAPVLRPGAGPAARGARRDTGGTRFWRSARACSSPGPTTCSTGSPRRPRACPWACPERTAASGPRCGTRSDTPTS